VFFFGGGVCLSRNRPYATIPTEPGAIRRRNWHWHTHAVPYRHSRDHRYSSDSWEPRESPTKTRSPFLYTTLLPHTMHDPTAPWAILAWPIAQKVQLLLHNASMKHHASTCGLMSSATANTWLKFKHKLKTTARQTKRTAFPWLHSC